MVNRTVPFIVDFDRAVATTESGATAISTTGHADLDDLKTRGTQHLSPSFKIDDRISTRQSGGWADLTTELIDNTLENVTYYHNGSITLVPTQSTYNMSDGHIHVTVDGDVTFTA